MKNFVIATKAPFGIAWLVYIATGSEGFRTWWDVRRKLHASIVDTTVAFCVN
jgi:hypothetical protein